MVGLDTNLLVRYFTQDDEQQSQRAGALLETHCTPESPGFITTVVICELIWVLSKGYGYKRSDIARLFRAILSTPSLKVESHALVSRALVLYEKGGAGFADYLVAITCEQNKALPIYTFDNTAIKNSSLFSAIP